MTHKPLDVVARELSADVDALPSGAAQLDLRLRMLVAAADIESKTAARRIEWWKTGGAMLAAAGVIWTIFKGVSDYSLLREQRERETLATAMKDLTNPQSAALRLSALMGLLGFMERPDYRRPAAGEQPSEAERIALAIGMQLVEDPSPAVRRMSVRTLLADPSMAGEALYSVCSGSSCWRPRLAVRQV